MSRIRECEDVVVMAKAEFKDLILFVDHVAVDNLKSLHVDVDDEHRIIQYEQYGEDEDALTILKIKKSPEEKEDEDEQ